MKSISKILCLGALAMTLVSPNSSMNVNAAEVEGWGDFKIFIDPGHAGKENGGLYGYSEAEKNLRVALSIRDYLKKYTDIPDTSIKLCRETDAESVDLTERTDAANTWGADFYYSIHSDSDGATNSNLFLFGGWNKDGVSIEKTPNGGKKFADLLEPNLCGVMRVPSRGVFYDRCYYMPNETTHANQYPYLHVNRESNMPSMLSEAGFHTLDVQQSRNLNADYKRLEGYAEFHTILEYRGLSYPLHTILTGVVTNTENNVPINGATITIGDKVYTTDSFESLFNQYTKNQDLIHNGFYMFEGLDAGKEYDVVFSAPGFTPLTKKVTILSDVTKTAAENVTFLDAALTSNSPAKVSGVSVDNLAEVDTNEDLVITFSRNMEQTSVESALSISPEATVVKSWDNASTLRLGIKGLSAYTEYTLTIKGDIAKNSQTQQKFDGNGDGTEGGDYVLKFTTMAPDEEAPYVYSTTPELDGEVVYTLRPVIRVEYSEPLVWNDDKYSSAITVVDKDGKSYDGVLKHELINGASVLEYFFKEDLPLDRCFLVTVAGNLPDKAGNLSEKYSFRFLSEYRPQIDKTVIDDLSDIGGWFQPGGSGSSDGLTENGNTLASVSSTSSLATTSCFDMNYSYDENAVGPDGGTASWQIRLYKRLIVAQQFKDITGVLQVYLHGDGSYNLEGFTVRANKAGGGVKVSPLNVIDYRGWKFTYWDLTTPYAEDLSGVDKLTANWWFDSLFSRHHTSYLDANNDYYEPDWVGNIKYDQLCYAHYDKTAVRNAKISDIVISDGVDNIIADNMIITANNDAIEVTANAEIVSLSIFNLAGQQLYAIAPNKTYEKVSVDKLGKGVFIVKATTLAGQSTKKVIL